VGDKVYGRYLRLLKKVQEIHDLQGSDIEKLKKMSKEEFLKEFEYKGKGRLKY
jgi:hypothetical protein